MHPSLRAAWDHTKAIMKLAGNRPDILRHAQGIAKALERMQGDTAAR